MVNIKDLFKRKRSATSTVFPRYVGDLTVADLARIPEEKLKQGIKLGRRNRKRIEQREKKIQAKAKPIKEEVERLDQERLRLAREIKENPTGAPYALLPALDKVLGRINECTRKLEKLGLCGQVWDRVPDDPLLQITYVRRICKNEIFRGEL